MEKSKKTTTSPQFDIPEELVEQLLSQVESPNELFGSNGLVRALTARLVEKGLNAELSDHLGYNKGDRRPDANARNGSTPKTLLTEEG